jgi:hypothetical protein
MQPLGPNRHTSLPVENSDTRRRGLLILNVPNFINGSYERYRRLKAVIGKARRWRAFGRLDHFYDMETKQSCGSVKYTAESEHLRGSIAPRGASACCWNWVSRRDHLRSQLSLGEVFPIQSGNECGAALLGTGAKRVVVRIGRHIVLPPNIHKFSLLP